MILLPILIAAASYSINDVVIAYETGEYSQAVLMGEEIINKLGMDLNDTEKVNLRTYIAFSYVALGETDKARQNFEYILSINPEYTLNNEFVSPKIIEVFRNAEERVRLFVNDGPQYYYNQIDPNANRFSKSNLILKSAVLPGWGQMDRKENIKSFTIGTTFLVSAIIVGSSYMLMNSAREKYINASSPEEAVTLYNDYNNLSKINRFSWDMLISTYLFNILDILWSR